MALNQLKMDISKLPRGYINFLPLKMQGTERAPNSRAKQPQVVLPANVALAIRTFFLVSARFSFTNLSSSAAVFNSHVYLIVQSNFNNFVIIFQPLSSVKMDLANQLKKFMTNMERRVTCIEQELNEFRKTTSSAPFEVSSITIKQEDDFIHCGNLTFSKSLTAKNASKKTTNFLFRQIIRSRYNEKDLCKFINKKLPSDLKYLIEATVVLWNYHKKSSAKITNSKFSTELEELTELFQKMCSVAR